jgi:putative ABC transport system ATP-binding protein
MTYKHLLHFNIKGELFHMPALYCTAGYDSNYGNSGRGKTTYLHILAGLADQNQVLSKIDSTDIVTLSKN